MTPVADIYCNSPKLCLEHSVARVALHVICGLKGGQGGKNSLF